MYGYSSGVRTASSGACTAIVVMYIQLYNSGVCTASSGVHTASNDVCIAVVTV